METWLTEPFFSFVISFKFLDSFFQQKRVRGPTKRGKRAKKDAKIKLRFSPPLSIFYSETTRRASCDFVAAFKA